MNASEDQTRATPVLATVDSSRVSTLCDERRHESHHGGTLKNVMEPETVSIRISLSS